MIDKNILKNRYYLGVIAFVIVSILSFLLFMILRYENKIEEDMFKIATSDALEITQHKALFINDILSGHDNYIEAVKKDEKLRQTLEKNIKNLITKNIKYSYILYKDKNDVFRFLADASTGDEKAMPGQKFDVSNNRWYELYTKKEPIVIEHTVLKELSISYLVPIMNHKEVELVLVIDFSVEKIEEISNIITLMKSGLILIIVFIVISLAVLTIQYLKYKKMKKFSFTDKLTNAHNRNYLHEIEDKIKLDEYVIAVLDIDYFKNINDTYGHGVGDIVLKKFGDILLSTIRTQDDMVIRYGGEEFVVLIKRKTDDVDMPFRVIDRMFENIRGSKIFINDEDYITITVSVGVNKSPEKSKNFSEAFKLADKALYEAKNSGRDKIKISEDY